MPYKLTGDAFDDAGKLLPAGSEVDDDLGKRLEAKGVAQKVAPKRRPPAKKRRG